MARLRLLALLLFLFGGALSCAADSPENTMAVDAYLEQLAGQTNQIPEERMARLRKLADQIRPRLAHSPGADLLFVCTHNSRRSHLAQVWAQIAAWKAGIANLRTFSCGTEATACNPRTIAALQRAGLAIEVATEGMNPIYRATYAPQHPPLELFSKDFRHASLTGHQLIAVMCCDEADKNCPLIPQAIARVPLLYADPKVSDGTADETTVYDARCKQIATEMIALMQLLQ